MLHLNCPTCQAPYELDDAHLVVDGLKIRCTSCGTVFPAHRVIDQGTKPKALTGVAMPPKRKRRSTVKGVWGKTQEASQAQTQPPSIKASQKPPHVKRPPTPAKLISTEPEAPTVTMPPSEVMRPALSNPAPTPRLSLRHPQIPPLKLPKEQRKLAPKTPPPTRGNPRGTSSVPMPQRAFFPPPEDSEPPTTLYRTDQLQAQAEAASLQTNNEDTTHTDIAPPLELKAPASTHTQPRRSRQTLISNLPPLRDEGRSASTDSLSTSTEDETTQITDVPPAPDTVIPSVLPIIEPIDDAEATQSTTQPAPFEGEPKSSHKGLFAALILIAVIAIGGLALAWTPWGPFGLYTWDHYLPAAGSSEAAYQVMKQADAAMQQDTYKQARKALKSLGDMRQSMGLNRTLWVHSLLLESIFQHRFGPDARSAQRAKELHRRLQERQYQAPNAQLARAAYAMAQGQWTQAKKALTQVSATPAYAAHKAYVDFLHGELELHQQRYEQAMQRFKRASKRLGALAYWGVIRSTALSDAALKEDLDALFKTSPNHVNGRWVQALINNDPDHPSLDPALEAVGIKRTQEGSILQGSSYEQAAAWTALGMLYENAQEEQAYRAYRIASDFNIANPYAHLGLAHQQLNQKQLELAQSHIDEAIKASKQQPRVLEFPRQDLPYSLEVRLALVNARYALAKGKHEEAKQKLETILAQHPDYAEAHLYLGDSALAMGTHDAAEKSYLKALKLRKHFLQAEYGLIKLYQATERNEDAKNILEGITTRADETTPALHGSLAAWFLDHSQPVEAEYHARQAIDSYADQPHIRLVLIDSLIAQNKLEKAQSQLAALRQDRPAYPGTALRQADLLKQDGQYDKALQAYAEAVKQQPTQVDAIEGYLGLQLELDKREAAGKTLKQLQELTPSPAKLAYWQGRLALTNDDHNKAIDEFTKATRQQPKQAEAYGFLAWALLHAKKFDKATLNVDKALELDPNNARAHWVQGHIYLHNKKDSEARKAFEQAIEQDDQHADFHVGLAEAYVESSRKREGIKSYRKALQLNSTHSDWWYAMGKLEYDIEREEDAIASLQEALNQAKAASKKAPPLAWLAEAHRLLAELYDDKGKKPDALAHYQQYVELAPKSDANLRDARRRIKRLQR